MQTKSYRLSKGFIYTLLTVILIGWLGYKCFPLTEEEQEKRLKVIAEEQRRIAAKEFDTITNEDRAKLPKFDYLKYSMIKRNGHFYLIPREFFGDSGFNVDWPSTVNRLLKKNWKDEANDKHPYVHIFMYSRQYAPNDYTRNENFSNKEPCVNENYAFIWNNINIFMSGLYAPDLIDEQYFDVCLTAVKILNEEIKEIY